MNHNQFSINWYPSAATQSSVKAGNQIVHKMWISDTAEAFDGITVGQDDQTKIDNSMENLTLADQCQYMGNQAVTQGVTELAEVRNDYQANKMFTSADDVHQLRSFGKDVNLTRTKSKMRI